MPTPRRWIIRGPAKLKLGPTGAIVGYSKDDIVVKSNTKTTENENSSLGKIDELINDPDVSIEWMPSSQVTNALLAYYFRYCQAQFYPGQSIFGYNISGDEPLVIVGRNGMQYAFPNTGIDKMPDLNAGGGGNPFGSMSVRALRPDNTSWSGGNIVNVTQAPYGDDSAYNPAANIITPFTGLWAPTLTGSIAGTSDANPDVITTTAANHGLVVGDQVVISGVTGDTAVNGTWYVKTVPAANTFTISATNGGGAIAGNAAYVSGGTFTRIFSSVDVLTATITADSDANPDVITTTAAHGFIVGDRVTISGVVGDNAANGTFYVATVPSPTTLTLNSLAGAALAGSGAYVSGGTIMRANGFDGWFDTEKGFKLSPKLTLNSGDEGQTDSGGQIDVTFQKLSVEASAIAVGPTPQELMTAMGVQGAGAARYQSLNAIGRNLYLSGNGLFAKLPMAGIKMATPIRASNKLKTVGDITWTATETVINGVPQPLATIGTSFSA